MILEMMERGGIRDDGKVVLEMMERGGIRDDGKRWY